MDNDRIEITDELIACYLEGNVTDEERAAVEAYLSESGETMDDVFVAKRELAYFDLVKRLVAEGIILDEKIQRKRKIRLYITGSIILAFVAIMSFWLWRIYTPLHMKVNIVEDKAYSIPKLPFEKGSLICEYADNAVQTITLTAENISVSLNDIPYKYKSTPVHIVFEADGYQTIDTLVPVQKVLSLAIRRNNDLGIVFGRVIDYITGNPVENAKVKIQNLEATTDTFGQFKIEIPFAQQDKAQLLQVFADGFPVWEGYYRPSKSEPWTIILGENQ